MYKYLYGPVHSWRFGKSLGVDPIYKTSICSFNCVYCQLGFIQKIQIKRENFISSKSFEQEVYSSNFDNLKVITFSGNGEPTLAKNIKDLLGIVKKKYQEIPTHLLTNSTLLNHKETIHDILDFDEICCKLDAIDSKEMAKINRPDKNINTDQILKGILSLRDKYCRVLSIQIMLLKNSNIDLEKWLSILKKIQPDKIYLNLPKRPYPKKWRLEYRGDHIKASDKPKFSEGKLLPLVSKENQEWIVSEFQKVFKDRVIIDQ